MALDWANPWQYSPVAWGSGLMNGFNPWANAWGMGGDDSTSDAGAPKSAQPQQGGSNADGSGESAGFAGDAKSGAYGMAKGAVGGLLGGLAKNTIATGVPAAALTGDAALGAGVGLASSFGPGFALGMGNMAAEASGYAPSTTFGKGVTAAVQNPFGMGLLGGMFGPLGLALGAMAPFGVGLAEDGFNARPAEMTKDAMEDAGLGRTAYNDALGFAKALQGPVASLALAETLARDINPEYSVSIAKGIGAGGKGSGAPRSGGPFAGYDGMSVGNVFGRTPSDIAGRPGGYVGGISLGSSNPAASGPMAGPGGFSGAMPGLGGDDGRGGKGGGKGGSDGGYGGATGGAKNGQGEGFGGR